MLLENINCYDKNKFESEFKNHLIYEKLYENYEKLIFVDSLDFLFGLHNKIKRAYKIPLTPRRTLTFSIFDVVPFYYLQYLMELNPEKIYDIGCGCNIFKKYIPNIIGIDVPESKLKCVKNNVDLYDNLDDSFYIKNFEQFESAFAICSLHFYPFSDIRNRVLQFSSLISEGGRGFITLNIARMLEEENEKYSNFNFKFLSDVKYKKSPIILEYLELFVREQLYNLPLNIEVFECSISECFDSYLNGNIRLVFTK
jgi:hypothetical protein